MTEPAGPQLDPAIARALAAMPPSRGLDIAGLPLDAALHHLRDRPVLALPVPEPLPVEERVVAGRNGDIPVRCYGDFAAPTRGIIANFHGGGWVMGSAEQDDYLCQLLARASDCLVVSAEYRLAPEAPYPGPLDDSYDVTAWCAQAAEALLGRDDRLVVCGSSAGANLAMGTALRAKTTGSFAVAAQLLLYPVCDAGMDTASFAERGKGYHLTAEAMHWFWDQYAPPGIDRMVPELSPLRAADPGATPPTLVVTAEFDPLRDEGARYAARLANAGVSVRHLDMPGLIHGFFRMVPDAPWVADVIGAMASTINDALAGN